MGCCRSLHWAYVLIEGTYLHYLMELLCSLWCGRESAQIVLWTFMPVLSFHEGTMKKVLGSLEVPTQAV